MFQPVFAFPALICSVAVYFSHNIRSPNNSPIDKKNSYANKTDTFNGLDWPENIFALSHVYITISPNDEYYGCESILGGINIKGEQKVLLIGNDLSRLRYNPLFDLVKISLEVSFFNSLKQNNVKSVSEPLN